MQLIDEKDFKDNISRKIKFYRKESQEKTAELASISTDTLSAIERALSVPSSLNLVNLANAMGITPNDILSDFITNKDKLLEEKFNLEFHDLSIEEKTYVLNTIDFIKNLKQRFKYM